MKISALSLALLSLVSATDVVQLTGESFTDYLDNNNLFIAEFFAPWCGHCKALEPEYEKAAAELKDHNIGVVKVDCTEEQELCGKYDVQGYPTLKVFNHQQVSKYDGARSSDAITKHMISRSLPVIGRFESEKELEEYLDARDVTVVTYFDAEDKVINATLTLIAEALRDRMSFVATSDAAIAEKYGLKVNPGVAVYKKDEEPVVYDGNVNSGELVDFLNTETFPTFGEIGPGNYAAYTGSGIPILYGFVETEEQRKSLQEFLAPHTKALKGKANIVFLNTTLYGGHAENVNLRAEFPALVVHDITTNKKYIHDQDVKLTAESVAEFATKYAAGTLEAHVKSAPVPETQDGPVFTLVGSQYDEIVLDETKDVLVEFYAPWCGHCKNLAPIYDQLGEAYAHDDSVIIAKVDHTENDVPDRIEGYPTIKLYPAGDKANPIEYHGDRRLEDFAKFIEDNGSNHVVAKLPVAESAEADESEAEADEADSDADSDAESDADDIDEHDEL